MLARFNWDAVNKTALLDTFNHFNPTSPASPRTAKEGLVDEVKSYLSRNHDKIDGFFRRLEEESAKPKAAKTEKVEGA